MSCVKKGFFGNGRKRGENQSEKKGIRLKKGLPLDEKGKVSQEAHVLNQKTFFIAKGCQQEGTENVSKNAHSEEKGRFQ